MAEITPYILAEAKRLYKTEGISLNELSKRFDVHPSTLGKALRKLGVRMRTKAEVAANAQSVITPEQAKLAVRLYLEKGMSLGEAGKALRPEKPFKWDTMKRALLREGVKLRTREEALVLAKKRGVYSPPAFDREHTGPSCRACGSIRFAADRCGFCNTPIMREAA